MSLKLKEESRISFNLEDFTNDDFVVALELSMLAFNIRREVCGVFNGFFHSSRNMKK
jgi:hypothetical protein